MMKTQKQKIRPNTENLLMALAFDASPSAATCVDFGIRTTRHLAALQFAYKQDHVKEERFDAALGKGEEIQKLISKQNPYRNVTFHTDWDDLMRTMSCEHPRWGEFTERLERALDSTADVWVCPGDLSKVAAVLAEMDMDVESSLGFLESIGCQCDCRVLFK